VAAHDGVVGVVAAPLLLDDVGDLAAMRTVDPDAGVKAEQRHLRSNISMR
jgi:hypothetical protein